MRQPVCARGGEGGGAAGDGLLDVVVDAVHDGALHPRRLGGNSTEKFIRLKTGLRFRFDSEACLNNPFLERFFSVGNLKPKLKWFFKPKISY